VLLLLLLLLLFYGLIYRFYVSCPCNWHRIAWSFRFLACKLATENFANVLKNNNYATRGPQSALSVIYESERQVL